MRKAHITCSILAVLTLFLQSNAISVANKYPLALPMRGDLDYLKEIAL
jgi:hypothetical protein